MFFKVGNKVFLYLYKGYNIPTTTIIRKKYRV